MNSKFARYATMIAISVLMLASNVSVFAKPAQLPATANERAQTAQANKEKEVKSQAQASDTAKERACENRENAIKKRSDQLIRFTNNQFRVFTSIADRVKTYYTDIVIPSGVMVENYNDLVEEIANKQATVSAELDKATAEYKEFTCSSEKPGSQISAFRTGMQAVKQALKDYRTSIKNLIVAVRSAIDADDESTKETEKETE